ncbi:hypothetical protein Kpol_223p1 [Vanderwaltozyma polyspora DSM 70294]|uniref:Uncharacterized protein n=1 Tax=Vanderwaltozyma polyspora (strain ATCC 22028 / DSM 70294 / BCRC 21397 / CBS 2163 / NBRC 10782 / NRRL Y-8283 / UCD 57-17) TaxID=436907 RepID=A7TTE4_VANPO|nr:uncharacterized protein Kpol_223p1 [Vanderwaltozyma polyspora DSM 70294]EDO14458.1 hypothetical protein Kpol_223p1 [Vanderwaltozyma polyspora DSM 70294]
MESSVVIYTTEELRDQCYPSDISSLLGSLNTYNYLVQVTNDLHQINDKLYTYDTYSQGNLMELMTDLMERRDRARRVYRQYYNVAYMDNESDHNSILHIYHHSETILSEDEDEDEDPYNPISIHLMNLQNELQRTNSVMSLYPRRGSLY